MADAKRRDMRVERTVAMIAAAETDVARGRKLWKHANIRGGVQETGQAERRREKAKALVRKVEDDAGESGAAPSGTVAGVNALLYSAEHVARPVAQNGSAIGNLNVVGNRLAGVSSVVRWE